MAAPNVLNLQGPLVFYDEGHEKNSYEPAPFLREIENRRTAQEPNWTDAETIIYLGKCLQGPALEWFQEWTDMAETTAEIDARKNDWPGLQRQWRIKYKLTEEAFRTDTVELLRYPQGFTPAQFHNKLKSGIYRMMKQERSMILYNDFPEMTEEEFFVATTDAAGNRLNVNLPENRADDMANVTARQRATLLGRHRYLKEMKQHLNIINRTQFWMVIRFATDRYPHEKLRKKAQEIYDEMYSRKSLDVAHYCNKVEAFYESDIKPKGKPAKANTVEDQQDDVNKVSNDNKQANKGKDTGGKANPDKGKSGNKGGNKGRNTKLCSYCKKKGHWRKECRKLAEHKKTGKVNEIQAADDEFTDSDVFDGPAKAGQPVPPGPPSHSYPPYYYPPPPPQYPPANYNPASGNGPWGQA